MAYNSQYYTCEEIDQRLLQGYYDDAVASGFQGTKEQFWASLLNDEKVPEMNEADIDLGLPTSMTTVLDILKSGGKVYKLVNDAQQKSTGILFIFGDSMGHNICEVLISMYSPSHIPGGSSHEYRPSIMFRQADAHNTSYARGWTSWEYLDGIRRVELESNGSYIRYKGESTNLTHEQVLALVNDVNKFVTLMIDDEYYALPTRDFFSDAIEFSATSVANGQTTSIRCIINSSNQVDVTSWELANQEEMAKNLGLNKYQEFSASKQYHAGDVCQYYRMIFRFKNDHLGAWSNSDVESITVFDDLTQKLSELEGRTSEIDKEIVETDGNYISVEDNNGNEVLHIDENGLDAKIIKSNGKKVATIEDIPVVEEFPISKEPTQSEEEEINFYDNEDLFASVRKDGIHAKKFFTLDDKELSFDRLSGKKVVCFGDSITDGLGHTPWTKYLADISGAIVSNVAKGGAQISQRDAKTLTPAGEFEARAAFDVCNVVYAFANADYSYMQAALDSGFLPKSGTKNGTYERCEAIMNLLKSINIADTDIVVVLGGTNDYTSNKPLGEDSAANIDVNTIYGAINFIISAIQTANPNIEIYWLTPFIRMRSTISPTTSSDTVAWNTSGNLANMLLPELSDKIEQAVRRNHIPCWNWYWEIGFNAYNFERYFGTDLTHPYYGFEYMANKIDKFLNSK